MASSKRSKRSGSAPKGSTSEGGPAPGAGGPAGPLLEFSAGGVVVDDTGRVLLIRARDLRGRPVWTLPKGALGPGESSADAARREVQEETGYRCIVAREFAPVTYWFQREGRRVRKTVRWFLMRPLERVGEHDQEVDEVRWVEQSEALALLRYDSDRKLLADLRSEVARATFRASRSRPGKS